MESNSKTKILVRWNVHRCAVRKQASSASQ